MAKKTLTEKQTAFLEALFGPARGDIRSAMDIAGYSENASASTLVASLKDEILERSTNVLAATAPRAAMSFGDVINDPTLLGAKELMQAAKEVLDRTGIVKVERVDHNISTPNGIFILPPKAPTSDNG